MRTIFLISMLLMGSAAFAQEQYWLGVFAEDGAQAEVQLASTKGARYRTVYLYACGPRASGCYLADTARVEVSPNLPYCKDGQTKNCIFDPVGPGGRFLKQQL